MNSFIQEAFFIGAKEGAKVILCTALVLAFLDRVGRIRLKGALFAGILAVFLASFGVLNSSVTPGGKDVIVRMIGYVFGLFYLFSLGALFHSIDANAPQFIRQQSARDAVLAPLVFLLTVLYFSPDMAGASLYVKDLFAMSGRGIAVPTAATAGFAVSATACWLLVKRLKTDIMRLFALPQVFLFLAFIKLIAGGVHGFTDFSLIYSVQTGLMKLIHDVVHQMLVMVMAPDHPLLTMTTWKYLGLLFSNSLSLWLSLIIMTLPLLLFIKQNFSQKVDVPYEMETGAFKRLFIKSIRDERILKSIPVFLFIVVIVVVWFVERGGDMLRMYDPVPTPIAVDSGQIVIPLKTSAEDLFDGALHKFSTNVNGAPVRLLVMKRSNGSLAVCLDACEVCPPDGYAQVKDKVLCIYCMTPLPIDSLGKPGGCNPIPVEALVTGTDIRIKVAELEAKSTLVKKDAATESGGK